MTKRFELLKPLPDAKVGDIFEKLTEPSNTHWYICSKSQSTYHESVVEESSNWFREVVEKDWEIMGYWNDSLLVKVDKKPGGRDFGHKEYSHIKINSVKRLSDGEVFTVGDEVEGGVIKSWYLITKDTYLNRGDVAASVSDGNVGDMLANVNRPETTYRLPNTFLKNIIRKPKPIPTFQDEDKFVWTADLVKEFCEYAGLRIGKNEDIRQQLNFLIEDFKLLTQTTKAGEGTSLDVKNSEGYTEDDLMKAFEAGRKLEGYFPTAYSTYAYETFQHYKKSL